MDSKVKKIVTLNAFLFLIFILNWINFQPIIDNSFYKEAKFKVVFYALPFIWFWFKGEKELVLTALFFMGALLNYAILKAHFFSYAKAGSVNWDFIIVLPIFFYLSYRVKKYLKD